ncbi:hypothetical protein [Alteromonas genovensis]|uniref:hypothetical protein n=1 Tax=Alteromonas genovensis TaxID=471225 RepID=UPI002FE3478D
MLVKEMSYRIVSQLLSLISGIFLCYFIVWLIGRTAAFTMSFEPYTQVIKYSQTLAFSVSGFITVGIPVALMCYVLAFALRHTVGAAHSLLLASPSILLILLGLNDFFSREDTFQLLFLTLAQYIPLIAMIVFLHRQEKRDTGT